jgi:hypothetical protein
VLYFPETTKEQLYDHLNEAYHLIHGGLVLVENNHPEFIDAGMKLSWCRAARSFLKQSSHPEPLKASDPPPQKTRICCVCGSMVEIHHFPAGMGYAGEGDYCPLHMPGTHTQGFR